MALDYNLTQTGPEVQQILDDAPVTKAELAQEIADRQNAVSAEHDRATEAEQALAESISDSVSAEHDRAIEAEQALADAMSELKAIVPQTASESNKLADIKYVIDQIENNISAFKGQFTTFAQLQNVENPKYGDIGIVRTKDYAGHDVYTFYQYKDDRWNEYYVISYHPQYKPASTGFLGDYPYNGIGRIELPKNMIDGWPDNTWIYLPKNDVVYLLYFWRLQLYAVYNVDAQEGLGLDDNLVVKPENYDIADLDEIVDGRYLSFTENGGVWTIEKPDESTITSTELNNTNIYHFNDPTHHGINVLTQEMINRTNTNYIIQYDYDLNGQTITVPKNCILEFDGGSLKNGTIIGQDTLFINVGDAEIWGENLTREGTWREKAAFIEVDDHLDGGSENPVQNKIVTDALSNTRINLTKEISDTKTSLSNELSDVKEAIESEITGEESARISGDTNLGNRILEEQALRQSENLGIRNDMGVLQNGLDDRYTKQEVNAIISRTPETPVVVLDRQQEQTVLDVLNAVPLADRPNKVFRVRGDNDTHYEEYGWTGNVWALLSSKNYDVDETPTPNSRNLVESGGIALLYGHYEENPEYISVETDYEGRVLNAITKKGEGIVGGINVTHMRKELDHMTDLCHEDSDMESNLETVVDKDGKLVAYRKKNGVLVELAGIESPSLDKMDYRKCQDTDKKLGILNNYMISVLLYTPNASVGKYKEFIDSMSLSGCTHLLFNPSMRLRDMQVTVNGVVYDFSSRTLYHTESEIEDIISYAHNRNIEVIPIIGFMTHNPWLSTYEGLLYPGTDDCLNINSTQAIDVGVAYTEMYAKWFYSRGINYIHIGCDEFSYPGDTGRHDGYIRLHDNEEWGYIRFINRVYSMLRSYGLDCTLWNDPVCVGGSQVPQIDKRITVCHWKSNIENNSPCIPTISVDAGYVLVNASQNLYWTYSGSKPTEQSFKNFDINRLSSSFTISYEHQKGCMFCIWPDGATADQHNDIIDTILDPNNPLVEYYGNEVNQKIQNIINSLTI